MTEHRYSFEFISAYDGISHYRAFRDGKDDGRIYIQDVNSKMTYPDGSKVLNVEVEAFNAFKRIEHRAAVAKYGENVIGACPEYWSS